MSPELAFYVEPEVGSSVDHIKKREAIHLNASLFSYKKTLKGKFLYESLLMKTAIPLLRFAALFW